MLLEYLLYCAILGRYLRIFGGSTDALKREVKELTIELEKLSSPLVFCHNDLLCGNIIYNEREGTVHMTT